MVGINDTLSNQIELLISIIKQNDVLYDIIKQASSLGLQNYYVGAGCIAQTVWNYQTGNDLMHGISDVDLVYYDNTDLSYEAECNEIDRIIHAINPNGIKLDIKNQARVHLWYGEHFGYDIKPYTSIENAINSWPTTATSIGVRLENEKWSVYAPYGLNDLFAMIVKANKVQITEEIFMQKAVKWIAKWSSLVIIPW